MILTPHAYKQEILRISGGGGWGGGGGVYRQAPKQKFTKKSDWVDTIILNVLGYLPFSGNQPLQSADLWCLGF
jgi:hypothetical protein